MTRGTTPRLGLLTSTSVSDTFSTQDILDDNTKLDANVLMYASGTRASRPAANKVGRLYYATDTGDTFWDTGIAWATISRGSASTYTVGMSQSQGISMSSGASAAWYTQTGSLVHAEGQVTTASPHPGGGGRAIFSLPATHAYGGAIGVVLGTFQLSVPSYGTFAGAVVTYGGPAVAGLLVANGSTSHFLGDNPDAFDMPASTSLSFNINYRSA